MLKYVSLLCLGLIAYAGVLVAAQLRLAQGIDDGAIEVLLKEDVQIGLQSRVQRGGFEERKVEFTMGGKRFSFDLPKNLYVKRTFKDAVRSMFSPLHCLGCSKEYTLFLE